jgi:hypothetical protein
MSSATSDVSFVRELKTSGCVERRLEMSKHCSSLQLLLPVLPLLFPPVPQCGTGFRV